MKWFCNSINRTGAISFLLLLGAGVLAFQGAAPAQAPVDPAMLWRDATLYRDTWGAPHVFAETPRALGFAFGYAQAEDHVESMLLAYRMANGRLSAVLGEAYAESDAFSLRMGHARLAQAALDQVDPVTRELCEGFALGVNSWLVDHPGGAPAWADGVQPQDVLALWHAFLMSFAPFDAPGPYRNPAAMDTGNAWALAPSRTVENRATLVINPHQYFNGPFQWYEAHLVLGDMNVYGAALRGIPVIVQGYNATLGWALTPNKPDFADLFMEQLGVTPATQDEHANPKTVKGKQEPKADMDGLLLLEYMSQSQPYYVRTDAGLEERITPSYIGPRGPFFENKEGGMFSWRIGGYGQFGGLRQLMEMGRSQNLGVFQEALQYQQLPCFHVVYADREGNIFYLYNTNTGVRMALPTAQPAQQDPDKPAPPIEILRWDQPLPARLDLFAWSACIPVAGLPAITNPASGYLQACGTTPWGATESSGLDPAAWPGWLVRDSDSHRARRARQLLRTGQRSFRDNQSMLFDTVASAAMETAPALLAVADNRPDLMQSAHPDLAGGLDLLRNWNFVADVNSTAMTYYHVWWATLRNQAGSFPPTDQDLYAALASASPQMQETALRAAADAASTLRNEFQTLSIPWGDVHRIRRAGRDEPAPGAASGEPMLLLSDQVFDQGKWQATYGPGLALVVQFGDTPEAVSLVPFGASDNPKSPHHTDQMDLLLERRFKPVRLSQEDVLRHAEQAQGEVITLLPLGVSGAVSFRANAPMQARLTTATVPPAELPAGMTAFTPFIQPERSPQGLPVQLDVSLHAPDGLYPMERAGELALFVYEEGLGWYQPDPQQFDATTRIFHVRQELVGKCYAVLGPVDALIKPPEQASPTGVLESSPQDQPMGIDVLLQSHALPQPTTGKAKFKFERLDKKAEGDGQAANGQLETSPPETPGKTFKLERLDKRDETLQDKDRPVMPEIPGFRFGPGMKGQAARENGAIAAESGKVFKLERLDKPALPGPATDKQDSPEIAPEPKKTTSVPGVDTTVKTVKPTVKKATESAPEKTSADKKDAKKNFNQRPALPDVIPQDSSFNYGPSFKNNSETAPTGGKGKFRIERLDKTTQP